MLDESIVIYYLTHLLSCGFVDCNLQTTRFGQTHVFQHGYVHTYLSPLEDHELCARSINPLAPTKEPATSEAWDLETGWTDLHLTDLLVRKLILAD